MKLKWISKVVLATCVLSLCAAACGAYTTWDLATDWTPSHAPSQGFGTDAAWAYGYDTNGSGAALDPFTFTAFTYWRDPVGAPPSPGHQAGYKAINDLYTPPYISKNTGGTMTVSSGGYDWPAGKIAVHSPDANNVPVIVRWTAPRQMTVRISGAVWRVTNYGVSARDQAFGFRKGSTAPLFTSTTGGNPAPTSASPYRFSITNITMQPGEFLDFFAYRTSTYDFTGVDWTITDEPPVEVVGDPAFSPPEGTYQNALSVTISSTSGATIHYTTDGGVPTESSATYFGAVAVDHSLTLRARAWKPGATTSGSVAADYRITSAWDKQFTGIVIAVFSDYDAFAVEAENRSFGYIVVPMSGESVQVGEEVLLKGKQLAGGVLALAELSPTGRTNVKVGPVGLNNRDIIGATGIAGLSNMGMLVWTWGKALDNPMLLPDGSTAVHITDGTALSGAGLVTLPDGRSIGGNVVQVVIPPSLTGVSLPSAGDYVAVTGVACQRQLADGDLRGVILCKQDGIETLKYATELSTLFALGTPANQWATFRAQGFAGQVPGVIYRGGAKGQEGVPLGGIGTGCIDINPDGGFGEWTIFNNLVNPAVTELRKFFAVPVSIPRAVNLPFLGLSVGGHSQILSLRTLSGVDSAHDVRYWGHYPVADLEYNVDGPVSVGLRACNPFVPGDADVSNTPGAVFDVELRNYSAAAVSGTVAFSFPGPAAYEANGSTSFSRTNVSGTLSGTVVSASIGSNGYALGVAGPTTVRTGGGLGSSGAAWANIESGLPVAPATDSGASVAVDFTLQPNEVRTVPFVLAWYAPTWPATAYTNMYATRFGGQLAAAQYLATNHDSLLERVLAWQQVIYDEETLPDALRDGLVNNLSLMTKASFYVSSGPGVNPATGLLSIFESGGWIPLQESCCVAWWGDFPITYFFPDLRLTTIRAAIAHQAADGRMPFFLGSQDNSLNAPNWDAQYVVNSMLYVQMIDRLLQRTGDSALTAEFFPAVKKAIQYTMTLSLYSDGLISLNPTYPLGQPWDGWAWKGNAVYIAGHWIASLRAAERMADAVGDTTFASQCASWITTASASLQSELWNTATQSYWLYKVPSTSTMSDTILAYQLDGQFSAQIEGLSDVFPPSQMDTVLSTVKRLCVTPFSVGAANGTRPDGSLDGTGGPDQSAAAWPSANAVLAATYGYRGDPTTGEDIMRKVLSSLSITSQVQWDFPQTFSNCSAASPGGGDYYWGMALWAAPPGLFGQNMQQFCAPGGFVDRILQAGR